MADMEVADAAADADPSRLTSSAMTASDPQRRFVRTAQAEFRVKNVHASTLAIEDAVAELGGFVVSNEVSSDIRRRLARPSGEGKRIELVEYTMRGSLTVRVPSDRTQALLRAIAAQAEFLDRRSLEATDVQLDLLRQRLAWEREQQTQAALGAVANDGDRPDRKAQVVAAQGDAKRQRDEALLQQREFEDKVAYSTVVLALYQAAGVDSSEIDDIDAHFSEHRGSVASRFGTALRSGGYLVLDAIVALTYLWPLWLVLAVLAWCLHRWRRDRPAQTPPAIPTASGEP